MDKKPANLWQGDFGDIFVRKTDNTSEKVNFVCYDADNERDNEELNASAPSWNNKFRQLYMVTKFFRDSEPKCKLYGLETRDNKLLALASTIDECSTLELEFIKTNPREKFGAPARKYLGCERRFSRSRDLIRQQRLLEFD